MNAYVGEIATTYDTPTEALRKGVRAGPLVLSEAWGYSIRAAEAESKTNILTLAVARFFGVILMVAALGLWVAPGAATGVEFMTMKLGASVAFVLLGGALFWRGRDVAGAEVQVDTSRSEFRFGGRTSKGTFIDRGVIAFAEGCSLYLAPETTAQAACLYLRLCGEKRAVALAEGAEATLGVLQQRIEMDLQVANDPAIDPFNF